MDNIIILSNNKNKLTDLAIFCLKNNATIDITFYKYIKSIIADNKENINEEIKYSLKDQVITTNIFNIFASLYIEEDIHKDFYMELINAGVDITKLIKVLNKESNEVVYRDNVFNKDIRNKTVLIKSIKDLLPNKEINERVKNSLMLHEAVRYSNVELLEALLDCNIDVDIKDKKYRTASMLCSNETALKLLIDHNADLSIKDIENKSIISYVNKIQNNIIKDKMKLLIKENSSADKVNNDEIPKELVNKHLIDLVKNGNLKQINDFIKNSNLDINNIYDENGNTLLMLNIQLSSYNKNVLKRNKIYEDCNVYHINNKGETVFDILFNEIGFVSNNSSSYKIYNDLAMKIVNENKNIINEDFILSTLNKSLTRYNTCKVPYWLLDNIEKYSNFFNVDNNINEYKNTLNRDPDIYYNFLSKIKIDYKKIIFNETYKQIFTKNIKDDSYNYEIDEFNFNKHISFVNNIIPDEEKNNYKDKIFKYLVDFLIEGSQNHTGNLIRAKTEEDKILQKRENKYFFRNKTLEYVKVLNEHKKYDLINKLKDVISLNTLDEELNAIFIHAKIIEETKTNKNKDKKIKI